MRKVVALLSLVALLNSCASILNSRYQNVAIITEPGNKILIDGKEPEVKNNKYRIRRDAKPKQVTIVKEGHKEDKFILMQNRRSYLYTFSVIPFGVLLYPMVTDRFPKAYNYPKTIDANSSLIPSIKKKESYKNIHLNKVALDIKPEDLRVTRQPYDQFQDKKDVAYNIDLDENIGLRLENTLFTLLLNETLAKNGFIDTTNRVLKGAYLNNLMVNATITKATFNEVVANSYALKNYYNHRMIYADMVIKWEVLDYFQQPIYSSEIKSLSGQYHFNNTDTVLSAVIKDAIEANFFEFMNSKKVIELLEDNSQLEIEKNLETKVLPGPESYADNLSSAVKASVTIRNKRGHGSGFFITNQGHIVTNYHVVSDTSNLKVVLNNGMELPTKVLRVSKIHDLALLKIDEKNDFAFRLEENKNFEIGSDIYAIGTPSAEDLSQTLSKGVISGFRKLGENSSLIQTDASINSGNSGGVITDKDGNVVGVVSSKLKGFGIEGVAFCIPTQEVLEALKLKINK